MTMCIQRLSSCDSMIAIALSYRVRTAPSARRSVQDRVVEADGVEPHHARPMTRATNPLDDGPGVIAPVADLELPHLIARARGGH